MNQANTFYTGTLDNEWSVNNRNHFFTACTSYFLPKLLPGQKLFICHDGNPTARYLAEVAAGFFSRLGIPIFISNKPLTPDMHKLVSVERYGCGSLSFFNTSLSYCDCILEVADSTGRTIKVKELLSTIASDLLNNKQPIEFYDPALNIKNALSKIIELELNTQPSNNRIIWNALYGAASPLVESLFETTFHDKEKNAYTLNSQSTFVVANLGNTLDFAKEMSSTASLGKQSFCNYAVLSSPDLSLLRVLDLDSNLEFDTLTICDIIASNLRTKNRLYMVCNSEYGVEKLPSNYTAISKTEAAKLLKTGDFELLVDAQGRFHFKGSPYPSQFIVLFVLLKELLFTEPISKEV